MKEILKKYSNGKIAVLWKPDLTNCWKASLKIFNPKRKPWINMNAGTTEEIIKIVDNCPSGALTYKREKKMAEQKAQPAQSSESKLAIKVNKGGPYLVKGKFVLVSADGKEENKEGSIALCRCGGSNNKPFCDGTHRKIGFDQG